MVLSSIKKKFKSESLKFKQSQAANKIIKEKARVAGLKEREKQAIKVAKEKERIRAKQKIKGFKTNKSDFARTGFGTLTDALVGTGKKKKMKSFDLKL